MSSNSTKNVSFEFVALVEAVRRWIALSEVRGTHTEVYATLGAYNGGWAINRAKLNGAESP